MVHLFLGLPGTGKTTSGKAVGAITLDLGGKNITQEGEQRLSKAFTEMIKLYAENDIEIYFDTYDKYFDIGTIKSLAQEGLVEVTVAIPTAEDMPYIFENIKARGDSDDFINLYQKNWEKWVNSWRHRWPEQDGVKVIRTYYKTNTNREEV